MQILVKSETKYKITCDIKLEKKLNLYHAKI